MRIAKITRAFQPLAMLLLLPLLSACQASACAGSGCAPKETHVNSLIVGHDYNQKASKVTDPGTTFKPHDTVHTGAEIDIAASPLTVKGVFTAVATDDGRYKEYKILDKSLTYDEKPTSGYLVHFDLSTDNPNGFPPGKYRFDLYLNDALSKSADFNFAG
jgi:hypothetical protein